MAGSVAFGKHFERLPSCICEPALARFAATAARSSAARALIVCGSTCGIRAAGVPGRGE
jgi:hypothetical protein